MSAIETRPETAEERVARLTARLQDGFTRIGEAMSQGVPVDEWETFWIKLLREYVSLEDELQARPAAVQVSMAGMPVERRREVVE